MSDVDLPPLEGSRDGTVYNRIHIQYWMDRANTAATALAAAELARDGLVNTVSEARKEIASLREERDRLAARAPLTEAVILGLERESASLRERVRVLELGLQEIRDSHIGDKPAALGGEPDGAWERRCHNGLRAIARGALVAANEPTSAETQK